MVALSASRTVLSAGLLSSFALAATTSTHTPTATRSSLGSTSSSGSSSGSATRLASFVANEAAEVVSSSAPAASSSSASASRSNSSSAGPQADVVTATTTTSAAKASSSTTTSSASTRSSFSSSSSSVSASSSSATSATVTATASATVTETATTETSEAVISSTASSTVLLTSASASGTSTASFAQTTAAACEDAPSTFSGTAQGLADVCSVRYCYPKSKSKAMSWSGYTGEVSRDEIESALGVIAHVDPVLVNGQGNVLSDGALGQTAYSAGLLFELTGDIRALDWTVAMADNILWLQQQELSSSGTIMWTGSREPVWPTYDLPPHNTTILQYAGCENGDAAGHMLAPALFILKNPCLYDLVPSFPSSWSGPTPFNSSTTYLERALAYIDAGDATVDYFIEYFLDKNDKLIQPDDPRWNLVGDTGNAPGDPMPWNRRFLTLHAFHKLATAHRHSKALDPSRASKLDKIIEINVADFMSDLNSTTTASGAPAYVWEYTAESETNTEEVEGVHAYFDIWGVFMAWQRFPNLVTDADATTLANTMQGITYLGDGTFSGLVNGKSDSKAPEVTTLWGAWSFYSLWLDAWWLTVAEANYNHGWGSSIPASIPLLWAKQARYLDSSDFWQGLYATDAESVSFSSSDQSGDGAQASAISAADVPTATATAATVGATVSVGDPIGGLVSVVSAQVSTILYGTSASLSTDFVTVAAPTSSAGVKVKPKTTKVVTTISGKVKTITKTIKTTTRKASHTQIGHGASAAARKSSAKAKAAAATSSARKSTGTSTAAAETATSSSSASSIVVGQRWEGVAGWVSSGVALAIGAGLFLLN